MAEGEKTVKKLTRLGAAQVLSERERRKKLEQISSYLAVVIIDAILKAGQEVNATKDWVNGGVNSERAVLQLAAARADRDERARISDLAQNTRLPRDHS